MYVEEDFDDDVLVTDLVTDAVNDGEMPGLSGYRPASPGTLPSTTTTSNLEVGLAK